LRSFWLPRLPDGKPNLSAPAPQTSDGKPDLSGLWSNDGGDRYYNNITAYLTTRFREFRIVQTPMLILLAFDDGMHRSIFMDGRSLEPDPNPTWMGYSVGHWEGDALIVESNGFTDRSWLDFGGHPHSEALRVTERYTRRDVGRMDVHVTMVDPSIYAKPIAFSMPIALQTDTEMLEGFARTTTRAVSGWCRRRLATSRRYQQWCGRATWGPTTPPTSRARKSVRDGSRLPNQRTVGYLMPS